MDDRDKGVGILAVGAVLTLVILAVFLFNTAHAATYSKWTRYFDRRTGNVVFIKTDCILAEDSAAHLKLTQYQYHGGRIVYGCYKKGY